MIGSPEHICQFYSKLVRYSRPISCLSPRNTPCATPRSRFWRQHLLWARAILDRAAPPAGVGARCSITVCIVCPLAETHHTSSEWTAKTHHGLSESNSALLKSTLLSPHLNNLSQTFSTDAIDFISRSSQSQICRQQRAGPDQSRSSCNNFSPERPTEDDNRDDDLAGTDSPSRPIGTRTRRAVIQSNQSERSQRYNTRHHRGNAASMVKTPIEDRKFCTQVYLHDLRSGHLIDRSCPNAVDHGDQRRP